MVARFSYGPYTNLMERYLHMSTFCTPVTKIHRPAYGCKLIAVLENILCQLPNNVSYFIDGTIPWYTFPIFFVFVFLSRGVMLCAEHLI